jgi:hypothetical protein
VEKGIDKTNCTDLSYRFIIPAVEFSVDRFTEALGNPSESDGWTAALLGSASSDPDHFHAHVFWQPDKSDPSKLKLQVEYHRALPEDEVTIRTPVAEDFFSWAGQFFTVPSLNFHLHAEFSYPSELCQVKIIPLPMKIPYAGKLASVNGISISMPTEPEGVTSVWIELTKKRLTLQLFADRKMELSTAKVETDVENLGSVVESLVEVKHL